MIYYELSLEASLFQRSELTIANYVVWELILCDWLERIEYFCIKSMLVDSFYRIPNETYGSPLQKYKISQDLLR